VPGGAPQGPRSVHLQATRRQQVQAKEFTAWPRIAGIGSSRKKKILFALQYIHGSGRSSPRTSSPMCKREPDARATNSPRTRWPSINAPSMPLPGRGCAPPPGFQQNIQRMKDHPLLRGERHRRGLPVRGQRTNPTRATAQGQKNSPARRA